MHTTVFQATIIGLMIGVSQYANADVVSYSKSILGMNESGAVVRFYRDKNGVGYGQLEQDGVTTDIFIAGSVLTSATSINNLGVVVGYAYLSEGDRGFLYKNGTVTLLNVPNARHTLAFGINDLGQIVGNYYDTNWVQRAFLYENGQYKTIGLPTMGLFDINNLGAIVGNFNGEGLILEGDTWQTFNVPGEEVDVTYATGINDYGQVVGQYMAPSPMGAGGTVPYGFLLNDNAFTKFLVPNSGATEPWGITNDGNIYGEYSRGNTGFGFVATVPLPPIPTPEPKTLYLLGAIAIAWRILAIVSNNYPVRLRKWGNETIEAHTVWRWFTATHPRAKF